AVGVQGPYQQELRNRWRQLSTSKQTDVAAPHTLDWYIQAESIRYREHAPWIPKIIPFNGYAGKNVLEIDAAIGTDLVQFAKYGAHVTALEDSSEALACVKENFRLRGLEGRFIEHHGDKLPFNDNTFDMVYVNGVMSYRPDTPELID